MSEIDQSVPVAPYSVQVVTETHVVVSTAGPLSVADAQALAAAIGDVVAGVGG